METGYSAIDDQVRVIEFKNDRISFEVNVPGAGWLLLREQFAPGWKAVCYRDNRDVGEPAFVKLLENACRWLTGMPIGTEPETKR